MTVLTDIPSAIDKMTLLQQCSFVSAPSIAQWAGVTALDVKVSEFRGDYRRKDNPREVDAETTERALSGRT